MTLLKRILMAMMKLTKPQISYLNLCKDNPRQIGVWCGFDRLTDLHNDWIKEFAFGKLDYTLQAHRGSYKTTCLSIAIALRIILYPKHNIIFLRKTDADVVEVINQVKKILTSEVIQHIVFKLYERKLILTKSNQNEISTNLVTHVRGAVQLLGIGVGGSLTGKHANIVYTDDIINMRDRISPAERNHTRQVYFELQNIKNRGGRIVNTGTCWHKEDAATLMPNKVKCTCFESGLMTRDEIEDIRQSMTPSLFAANYELEFIATEDALFTTPPRFEADKTKIYNGICHIDAAYGGKDGSAFTIARKMGNIIYVLGKIRKTHIDNCLNEFLKIKEQYFGGSISTEDNADKGYLAKEIRRRGGFANEPYHESMNKYVKISTYLKRAWNNIIFMEDTDPEYLNEIMDYTENAEHDDCADSAASLLRLIDVQSNISTSNLRI